MPVTCWLFCDSVASSCNACYIGSSLSFYCPLSTYLAQFCIKFFLFPLFSVAFAYFLRFSCGNIPPVAIFSSLNNVLYSSQAVADPLLLFSSSAGCFCFYGNSSKSNLSMCFHLNYAFSTIQRGYLEVPWISFHPVQVLLD